MDLRNKPINKYIMISSLVVMIMPLHKYSTVTFQLNNKFLSNQKELMTVLNTLDFHLVPEMLQDLIIYANGILDKLRYVFLKKNCTILQNTTYSSL